MIARDDLPAGPRLSPTRAVLGGTFLGAVVGAAVVMQVVARYGPASEHTETLMVQLGAGVGALLGLIIGAAAALVSSLAAGQNVLRERLVRWAVLGGAWTAGVGASWQFFHYFDMAYRDGAHLADHGAFDGLVSAAQLGMPIGGIAGLFLGLAGALLLDRVLPTPIPERPSRLLVILDTLGGTDPSRAAMVAHRLGFEEQDLDELEQLGLVGVRMDLSGTMITLKDRPHVGFGGWSRRLTPAGRTSAAKAAARLGPEEAAQIREMVESVERPAEDL